MNFRRYSFFAAVAAPLLAGVALTPSVQAATLKVGINVADLGSLDPIRATQTQDVGLVSWMFDGLVRFKPGSAKPADIEPDLATSWETSDDGLVWTFHLSKGVQFQGGYGELTADDVVFSLDRAKDPETSSFAADYKNFQSIKALDPYTVQITLSKPVPGFLGLVANYHGGNIVSKKAVEKLGAKFKSHPIGTGPFAFKDAVTQQSVTLVAFKKYFRGTPKLDGVEMDFIPSDSSRELAFQSGELDLIFGKREQRWVEKAKQWDNTTVDIFAPGEYRTLFLNMAHPPLDKLKVRQAIAAAINVDQIVAFSGKSVAQKGCSIVPNGYLGEDCTWQYKYDPARAKKLLAEAGFKNGLTLKAVVSSIATSQPLMEVVQAQLADVGITLKMNIVDHPTYHAQIRKDLSDIVFYGAARFPIADSYLTQFYDSAAAIGKPTAITNFAHCAAGDAAIAAAKNATTDKERLKYWSAAQHDIHDQVCSVPLFTLQQVWARHNNVHYGYVLHGAMGLVPLLTEKSDVVR